MTASVLQRQILRVIKWLIAIISGAIYRSTLLVTGLDSVFLSGLMARDGETQTGSHSWNFLLGVVALTLSTSTLIVCAVKSPSWYKLLFNYRHQRLREDVEHSRFSLDTEQTDTSTQELDTTLSLQPFQDEDDDADGRRMKSRALVLNCEYPVIPELDENTFKS